MMSYGYQGQLFSDEQHDKLGAKLKDIHNGLQGYVELQTWVKEELGVKEDYFNLRKNMSRSVSVPRSSELVRATCRKILRQLVLLTKLRSDL